MTNKFFATLEQDPNDPDSLLLPFPQDLLDQMGWQPGDVLLWHDNSDGTFSLTKKENINEN